MRSNLSILALSQWDEDIWEGFTVPTGLTKNTAIQWICETCAELEILYPDADVMKSMITLWSNVNQASWNKIYTALTAEYNPIHNFDRYEEWSDTQDNSNTSTNSGADTVTGRKMAYNGDTFTDATQNTTSLGTSNETEFDGSQEHEGHLYGNIGVTKSQDMVKDEILLRTQNNMYQILADSFKNKFCLLVY